MKLEVWMSVLGRTVPATLLAAGVGCAGEPVTGPQPDPDDTVAPLVVSTTPTTSDTGVASDVKIHITFSEPMDPATVMAAYDSPKLPLDKVSTQWNADQTVLSISPDAALLYADGFGNDPESVTPVTYAISIGADAADLMGNPMGAAHQLSFSTKVRMVTTASLVSSLSRTTLGGTALGEQINVIAGDASVGNFPYRGYVSFDLAALPQGIEVESASFSARQLSVEGTPYGMLGALQTYHITFSTMDNIADVVAISAPGAFSQDGNAESKSIDVTSQMIDDIANRQARGDRSQYRLQFDTVSENNEYDRAEFAKDTFEMSIVYVAD